MEAYRLETREIIQRFLDGEISPEACFVELDVAFAALVPRMSEADVPRLRAIFLANSMAIEKEIKRRRHTGKVRAARV